MTLGEAVERGLHPQSWVWTFLGGYKAKCKIVAKRHPSLGGDNDALSWNFGEVPKGMKGVVNPKVAYVFFAKEQEWVRFLHTLFHEFQHCTAEWSGFYHEELLEKSEAEWQQTKKK